MTTSPLLETLTSFLSSDDTWTRLGVIAALAAIAAMWLLDRRRDARENRFRLRSALQAASNFWAPQRYDDLAGAVHAVRDALAPFPALHAHGRLIVELATRAWGESRERWESAGGDDLASGAVRATLVHALDDLTEVTCRRTGLARWRQRLGAHREVQQIRTAAGPTRTSVFDPEPDEGALVMPPEGVYATIGWLRRAAAQIAD